MILSPFRGRVAFIVALSLLASFAWAEQALAQQPTINAQGTCLDEAQMYQGGKAATQDARVAQKAAAQTIGTRTPMFRGPDLRDPVQGADIPFGSNVLVFREQSGSPPRALVRDNATNRCGWINGQQITHFEQALKVFQIPGYEDRKSDSNNPNALNAKVVIKSINNDQGEMLQVPYYGAPYDSSRGTASAIGKVGYFAVLEVFEVKNSQGVKCPAIADPDCFFLVGGSQLVGEVPVPTILGWVSSANVELWSNALSVYYAPGKANIPIFGNERDAKIGQNSKAIALQEKPVGEPKERNIPRFPLLFRTGNSSPSGGKDIYEIVFAGRACADAACTSPMDAPTVFAKMGELGEAIYRSQGIDVLFVVDGTESMDRYYPPVIDAVRAVAERARRQNLRMRFSVATYGDYLGSTGSPENVQYLTVAPFRGINDSGALENLKRFRQFSDQQRDYPEAPFAGLIRAVNSAEWGKPDNTLVYLVIWIGDHGNRSPGLAKTRSSVGTLNETVTVDAVAQSFRRDSGKIIAFSAINVRGDYKPEFNQLFQKNARDLAMAIGADRSLPLEIVQEAADPASDATNVRIAIERKLSDILATSASIGEYVRRRANNDTSFLPTAPLAKTYLLEGLKLTDEKLQKHAGQIQEIRRGYIVQDDRKPDFTFWLALRQKERDALYEAMRELCESLTSTDIVDNVDTAMRRVLQSATFEEVPKTANPNIAEFLEKRLSVPKRNFAPILNQTLAEFVRGYFGMTKEQQAAYQTHVCRRMYQLELIAQNIRIPIDDIVYENSRWTARKSANPERFEWSWTVDTSSRYYFVPLDFLP
jgi:hypothetical protein